ncbi:hypothetical protein QL849_000781 [Enterococcus faecium]|nr:hypothetical protein [Enterococcus faecium]
MRFLAKVFEVKNNWFRIQSSKPINREFLNLLADGQELYVEVKVHDNRKITSKQNALSHSLIRDIARYSNDYPERTELLMKYYYKGRTGEVFSHRLATRHEANQWIHFLIDFVLEANIELPGDYIYLLEDDYWFYSSLKHRKCCLCGEHADIAHFQSVGAGKNRKRTNHRLLLLMALCRKHHQLQHQQGVNYFVKANKIIPVRLEEEDILKLKLTSKKVLDEFKEQEVLQGYFELEIA